MIHDSKIPGRDVIFSAVDRDSTKCIRELAETDDYIVNVRARDNMTLCITP